MVDQPTIEQSFVTEGGPAQLLSNSNDTAEPDAQIAPARQNIEHKREEDVPPDGGYGWVVVACVFWINAHTWGVNSVSSYGYMIDDNSNNSWTRLTVFRRLLVLLSIE